MINNFKKPDLKKPRFRTKVFTLLNKIVFDEFKELNPAFSNVDNNVLRNIIIMFNKSIWSNVIKNRDGVELPKHLGYLFIGTCNPPKALNVDYSLSKKYGKVLQNENWETDGHLGKIFYTNYNTKYRFKNRDLWKFEAHRDFKRTVAKEYPKNWTKYLQIENKSNLSYLYLKETEEHLEEIKTYNEFEF